MSFDSRLRHTLVVRRQVPTGVLDDYGQPVTIAATVATVAGLVQPRRFRESASASQAGVVVGDHIGYLRPLAALSTDCWIEYGGARYDILAMPDAAGLGHHLELELRRVG